MKASQLMAHRFSKPPAELTAQTKILGRTTAEWEKEWVGDFRIPLRELEERTKQARELAPSF